MSEKEKSLSALAIDFELACIRKRCLSDDAFSDGALTAVPSPGIISLEALRKSLQELEALPKSRQKLDQDRERFIQRADADQRKQINNLWQFHQAAKYGPALSASWKRTRRAMLFNGLCEILSRLEPAPASPPDFPRSIKVLTAIHKTAQKDTEFWNDATIAAKLKNTRSPVNWFLAEYSWLMLSRRPTLTFGELHKILHWINPSDLRKKIRYLRKRYGEFAVPLKRGRPGRPSQK